MKKHLSFLMLLAVSLMAFTGCKKDDDATLEGTWKLTKQEYAYYENDVLRSSEVYYPNEDDGYDLFSFEGNLWTTHEPGEAVEYRNDQTYMYSDGTIKLYNSEELSQEYSVKTLTERTLVFSEEDIDETDGVVEKRVIDYTLERQ